MLTRRAVDIIFDHWSGCFKTAMKKPALGSIEVIFIIRYCYAQKIKVQTHR